MPPHGRTRSASLVPTRRGRATLRGEAALGTRPDWRRLQTHVADSRKQIAGDNSGIPCTIADVALSLYLTYTVHDLQVTVLTYGIWL